MDFVERWFGTAPDGGNGAFERLLLEGLLVAVLVGLSVAAWLRARRASAVGPGWRRHIVRWGERWAERWNRDAALRDAE
jgi:hypothetical protein